MDCLIVLVLLNNLKVSKCNLDMRDFFLQSSMGNEKFRLIKLNI